MGARPRKRQQPASRPANESGSLPTPRLLLSAVRAALKIDKSGAVLRKMMESDSSELIENALRQARSRPDVVSDEEATSWLEHKSDEVRLAAVGVLFACRSRSELEDFLLKYVERPTYYYNVVTWLDRVLYAPAGFREYFQRILAAE
jgi:hypothetical protein